MNNSNNINSIYIYIIIIIPIISYIYIYWILQTIYRENNIGNQQQMAWDAAWYFQDRAASYGPSPQNED